MRHVKAVALAMVLLAMGAFSNPPRAEASFDLFYSNLSPHGSWLVSAQYGRVWQPSVYRPGWNPYYDGRWAYTDLGWTWISDYDWGATPYHYGTWVEEPEEGWVWIPGYVWGPSWVVFSSGDDYIGWAPVPPNYSMTVSLGYRDISPSHFVFVPSGNFLAPHVRSYAVPPSRTTVIINRTKIVNNIMVQNNVVVNRGPDVTIVERASGRKIRPVPIEQVETRAHGPRFAREEIRVNSNKARADLRVAEPRSAKTPLPASPGRASRPGSARPMSDETTVSRGSSPGRSVDRPMAPAAPASENRAVIPATESRTPRGVGRQRQMEEPARESATVSQGQPHGAPQSAGTPAPLPGKRNSPKKEPKAPKQDNGQDSNGHHR